MATGWANEGAVLEQIDSTIADAVARVRQSLPKGESLLHCEECGTVIPEGRRKAVPGVRFCVACQDVRDRDIKTFSGYNRRGSKDSQLR